MRYGLLILVVGVVLTGNTSKGADAEPGATPLSLIIPDSTLAEWGYRAVTNTPLAQEDWQIKRFGKATGRDQAIKAFSEVPDWPHTFYRFTLTEEIYPSPELALVRLNGLLEIPPSINTKMNPNLMLRKGFSVSNRVFTVSTDVYKFYLEELPRVFQLLKTHFSKMEAPSVPPASQEPIDKKRSQSVQVTDIAAGQGIVCIDPITITVEEKGTESHPTSTFTVAIDHLPAQTITTNSCGAFTNLDLTIDHVVKIKRDGKPEASFKFNFQDKGSNHLRLWYRTQYGTWQLSASGRSYPISFGLEELMNRKKKQPAPPEIVAVLHNVIRSDIELALNENKAINENNLFAVVPVTLDEDGTTDYLVYPALYDPAFCGAHAISCWLFTTGTNNTCRLVLAGFHDSISILARKTNGMRDVELVYNAGAGSISTYRYDGQQYKQVSETEFNCFGNGR